MHLGRAIGLEERQLWELYYTLLLKDLGCSSNAARICELYLTDDLDFKRDFKQVGDSLPQVVRFVLQHTGLKAGLAERFKSVLNIFKNGSDISRQLIQTRCQRGAEIARLLRFSEGIAQGIYNLDEHWNGQGKPAGLVGGDIPVYARIALLSQVVDVFYTGGSKEAALTEAVNRSGQWFEPRLVAALQGLDSAFWDSLRAADIGQAVLALEPSQYEVPLDEDYLDDIAAAFGQVVDSKCPYTSGHSARVALYTDLIGQSLGLDLERRRWLKRGALLHDVGKLGVSNSVLDKAGALDAAEWAEVRQHAALTESILSRISAFSELARIAGAHHERLDGGGYPRGLLAPDIAMETRIITTADIFDAITAERPYRGAVPVDQTLAMMKKTVGTAIDADCYEALCRAMADVPGVAPL
jgi:HD-GYP domain-containing protein (c-di-GMP phosphodiesterase class II)